MLSKLYFDVPARVTPAIHLAVECLGGLDLTNPESRPEHGQIGFALKVPRELTLADILAVNQKLATHFNTNAATPDDETSFASVAQATELTAQAIAQLSGNDWEGTGCIDEFSPAGSTDELLYGLLHWSFDGNNLTCAAY